MKNIEKTATSSSPESQKVTDDINKHSTKKSVQDEPIAADDSGQKIDRPGFDLGGSSGNTHAGTGLGLGNNSSDTPGDRRLPGRRADNKPTIPRWGGPESDGPTKPSKKPAGRKT